MSHGPAGCARSPNSTSLPPGIWRSSHSEFAALQCGRQELMTKLSHWTSSPRGFSGSSA